MYHFLNSMYEKHHKHRIVVKSQENRHLFSLICQMQITPFSDKIFRIKKCLGSIQRQFSRYESFTGIGYIHYFLAFRRLQYIPSMYNLASCPCQMLSLSFLLLCLSSGRLITGDCNKNIHLWNPKEGGTWLVDQRPFTGHTKSVEDLQWSPTEDTVNEKLYSHSGFVQLMNCLRPPGPITI